MKLNFPNILVLVRLVMVPIIVVFLLLPLLLNKGLLDIWSISSIKILWTDIVAGILFIAASITDWLDGWYARKHDQVTTFGKLFDPLADKILVNSVLIVFSARGIVPIIFTIIFIARDILVDGLRMVLASNGTVIAANRWGKLKTIFQMTGLSLLFFVHANATGFGYDWTNWQADILLIPLTIGLGFSIYSGINYYIQGFQNLEK